MAIVQRLGAKHFRNLAPFSLTPHPAHNLIYGHNASGKSSLLEAVYVAGYGRSSRGPLRYVVRHQEDGLRLHTEVGRPDQAAMTVVVEYKNGRTTLAGNGSPLPRASELAQILPVLLINTDSHDAIAGGPQQRRRMLDWGVFHVEHRYAAVLTRYQTALRQRNLCLQDGPRARVPAQVWNDTLAAGAAQIHAARAAYVAAWLPLVRRYLQGLLDRTDLELVYRPGWDAEYELGEVLRKTVDDDRRAGYTRHGPHRADLEITIDGVPAEHRLSRGQQKLLVCALAFAQAAALQEYRGEPCVMLIDDLAAELDAQHRTLALEMLTALGAQSFISVTEAALLPPTPAQTGTMFHVEHGIITECYN